MKIEGIVKVKEISNTVFLINSAPQNDLRKAIFNFAVASDNSVLTIQKEERKLEDVFKDLTSGK